MFTKLFVKNVTKWNGIHLGTLGYPRSPRDIRVFKIPQSNEEYTNFVNLIESYKRGRTLNEKSKEIISKLKNGQTPLNINHLSYLQQKQPTSQPPTNNDILTNEELDECPICLSPLDNTTITT